MGGRVVRGGGGRAFKVHRWAQQINKPQINDSSLSDRIPADVRYCELTAEFHLDS